jgi:hypothetical protein
MDFDPAKLIPQPNQVFSYKSRLLRRKPASKVALFVGRPEKGILLFSAKPVLAVIMLMAIYVLSCGKIERKLLSRQNG